MPRAWKTQGSLHLPLRDGIQSRIPAHVNPLDWKSFRCILLTHAGQVKPLNEVAIEKDQKQPLPQVRQKG